MYDVIVVLKMEVLEYLYSCGLSLTVFDKMLDCANKREMTVQGASSTIKAIERWYAENAC